MDLDELERLAQAARKSMDGNSTWYDEDQIGSASYADDAYIAALSPTVCLSLLRELRAARAVVDVGRDVVRTKPRCIPVLAAALERDIAAYDAAKEG